MTAQELIQTALLTSKDTDEVGHIEVELLADLRKFHRTMYDYVIRWQLSGVAGYETTTTDVTPALNTAPLPTDFYAMNAVYGKSTGQMFTSTDLATIKALIKAAIGSSCAVWSMEQGNICVYPSTQITLIYYPELTPLDLTTTFPGNTKLDNAAISMLNATILKSDRTSGMDIRLELMDLQRDVNAAKVALLHDNTRMRTMHVPIWQYVSTRGY